MSTYFDDASLVMIPSGYKDDKLYSIKPTSGDGDFTFSRDGSGASPATRVNASGLIEKGRTNELLQSNTFNNASWSKSSAIAFAGGQSGYDGTNDAWTATPPASTGNSAFYQSNISNLSTSSIYAKYNGYHLRIRVGGTGGNRAYATFDLQNGTIGNSGGSAFIDANIESIGSGWYRCSLTKNYSTAGFAEFQISENATDGDNPSWTPNGTDGIYIQDAQLEKGLVATSYIETTTAAASAGILGDMPRLDYSGGATCPSLLLEPSRVNVFTQSEYFGAWSLSNATLTANDVESPEGVVNGYKLNENTANSTHRITQTSFVTAGQVYTQSVFAKGDGSSRYLRMFRGSGTYNFAVFNLTSGEIVSQGGSNLISTNIEAYSNGWYKCSLTFTAQFSNIASYIGLQNGALDSYTGDGTSGIYIYGAQLEAGSYPTSYVPTYGSATARAKDVCNGAGDSSLFNDSEGVLFAEVSFARDKATGSERDRISLSDGTSNNRILITNTTTANEIQVFIRNSSGTIFNETITLTDITDNNKIAVRYKAGDYALYVNGTEEATGTSTNVPSGLNELMFDGPTGNYEFEGKVKQAIYFDSALTDAECISLTTL